MLECKGVVRNIGKAPEGSTWQIKFAKGIPFLTDSKGLVKKWCMSVFQHGGGCEADSTNCRAPMHIDVNKVTGDDDDEDAHPGKPGGAKTLPANAAPAPVGSGQPVTGTPRLGVKSVSGSTGDSVNSANSKNASSLANCYLSSSLKQIMLFLYECFRTDIIVTTE